MRKRLTAALLCLCLLFTLFPATAFAEGAPDSGPPPAQSALCEHHPSHDEVCGYTEGTEGSPCTHEHDEDCYTLVTECVHEHTTECYPAESVSENTATPSQPEEAELTACAHVCTEESGCITEVLNCKHEHDEACGYVPATKGTPCAFVCEVCNAQDSGNLATPSDAQSEECTCETLCTEEEINADCPVCSAEGVELDKVCVGAALMLPVTALAAGSNTVYVGGVALTGSSDSIVYAITNENGEVIAEGATADNYNIKWDGSTLTLCSATIKKELYDSNLHLSYIAGAAIGVLNQYGDAELTITLEGPNRIEDVSAAIHVFASSGSANLTITGDGILSASSVSNPGIRVQSNTGNGTLAITGAKVTASSSSSGNGVQIRVGDGSNASLTVNGGSLTATGSGATFTGIKMQFGSRDSSTGTPTVTVSGNAIVRANGIAGGITSNSSTEVQVGDGNSDNGGIVFDGENGTVYGNVTLQEDLTIGEDESLDIPSGASLDTNGKLTVDGGTLNGTPNGDVTYKVTGVSLNKGSLTLNVGESETLTATITPDNATDKSLTWESSDTSIATVDTSGTVTAVAQGTATITVTTADSGKTATCTVTVNPVQYTVTVQTDGNGSASASPATAPAGTTVTLTADPDSGYHFERWEIVSGGVTISGNQFTMPAENVTVKAVFDRNSSGGGGSSYDYYTITATAGEGGAISPSGSTRIREGRDQTYTITPDDGYRISDVLVDGESVGAVESYTFDNVQKRHTIEAVFAKKNPDTGNPFTDVHPDDWFYDDVMYVLENGLMAGTSDTTFSPNDPITRAQVAVIFYRMAGSPAVTGDSPFTDVENGPGTAWYYSAVLWAQQNGIVAGYGDGTFQPGTNITREQLAVIFYNYAKYQGYNLSAVNDLSGFTDAGNVSPWALDAMRWAVGSGIMGGFGDGILGPQETATRAQVAAMLRRFIENNDLVPPAVVPGGDGGTTGTGSGSGGWTQQVTSPQTGDSSNIGLWLSLMLLSFSGIVALLVTEKVRCAERRTRKPRTR